MIIAKATTLIALFLLPALALAQTQTTGRIAGTVKDQNGAIIAGAEVTVISTATGDERKVTTDEAGHYAVSLLPSGTYQVSITASGFKKTLFDKVKVAITETMVVNADLAVGAAMEESVTIHSLSSFIQTDGPQLGRVVDSRAVSELPLATRNFTQILGLSPGTAVDLPDNTAVGRNSQNVSVNGARTTQNNFQINGVFALNVNTNATALLAVPAPETIQEFKVQTSLYDATFGRSGGGNIQVVTKSGSNGFHGGIYEYFRNDALNANNPFLKAAGVRRPVLQRGVFGGLLGGPLQRDRAFFFISYQGTRERNGASPNSLSASVLVALGLTTDRSEQTLLRTFRPLLPGRLPATSIHPIALSLLNVQLPNGQYLIPTPQANGRYSGSAPSRFREDQFNTNIDYRINEQNWLAMKFFFSNAPSTLALPATGGNVPGFSADEEQNNRIISFQDVHSFSPRVINEARIGYNFIRNDNFPQAPVKDSDVGIRRANANAFPGLPLIRIAPNAGGVSIGTGALSDANVTVASTTAADTVSITWNKHSTRMGAEIVYHQNNLTNNQNSRGGIDFNSFNDFLTGTTLSSVLGTGISERNLRATDYNFFVQDDWKVSPKLTLNVGLRYELNLPPYDTRGRLSTFDPALYKPRLEVDSNGDPIGPPIGGFIQAGNVIERYNLPDLPKVDKRVLTSIDPDNFAPRLGFAYSPLASGRLVVRGGYGIFYSRASNLYLFSTVQLAPYYVTGRKNRPPFVDPFFAAPSPNQFPTFLPGVALANQVFDRNIRTPYVQQYNTSLQYAVGTDLLLEVAYVGTHGLNLFRVVGFNQARLVNAEHPITNEVTGQVITTNTPTNAPLRAPFQGVSTNAPSGQNQSTAQSSYNSLQMSLTGQFSRGLQFLVSYTYAKSIDNTSSGSGSGVANEVAFIAGNQLDNRANRGVSNFDRTHRFVLSYLWDLPQPAFAARSTVGRWLLSNWQVAGIIVAMSGLPIDIVDTSAGSFYGLSGGNNPLARPSWAAGATRSAANSNIPAGYFFNPFAFARPVVLAGQLIPSSNGTAAASATGTDFGNVGRNVLRGPRQTNIDFSIIKRFPFRESKNIELRAEFFNLFNHVNFANPISNLNAVLSSGGSIDPNTGHIINPGDFGRITSTSNNPRLIQLAAKFSF
ncbi:MAG: carboxypeptidase regulatory-like domain-containing protein [Pyrinomonadaceae bacterium]